MQVDKLPGKTMGKLACIKHSRGIQNASAGSRTRVTSMATMYSTTRPLMLDANTSKLKFAITCLGSSEGCGFSSPLSLDMPCEYALERRLRNFKIHVRLSQSGSCEFPVEPLQRNLVYPLLAALPHSSVRWCGLQLRRNRRREIRTPNLLMRWCGGWHFCSNWVR